MLDSEVWTRVSKLLTQPEMIVEYAKKWAHESNPSEREIDIIEKKLAEIEREEQRCLSLYVGGKITESEFDGVREPLKQEKAGKQQEIAELRMEIKRRPTMSFAKPIESKMEIDDKISFVDKKAIIQSIVKRVVATKEKVMITGVIPVCDNKILPELVFKKFGLKTIYADGHFLNPLPFEISFKMPKTIYANKKGCSGKGAARAEQRVQ